MAEQMSDETNPPSDYFIEAFRSGHGACRMTCACGIEHFDGSADGHWDWDEGELEHLRDRAFRMPSAYIEASGTVSSMEVGGMVLVIDCPCNRGARYERFITENAVQIANYLRLYRERIRARADSMEIGDE